MMQTLQLGLPELSSPNRPTVPIQASALSDDGDTLAAHFPDHGIGVWRVGQAD